MYYTKDCDAFSFYFTGSMWPFGQNTFAMYRFYKTWKNIQRNRSQKLKWADKAIWWTVQKHIMEVNGALLNRSSQRRKRLWWRRWAFSLGCTCQMDRNWQHHGLSRLRRCNSSGDLQSRPGKGSNNNTHKKKGSKMSSRKLPLTQPLYTVLYWARDLGGKDNS